ncbi:arsenate reductase family protein [Bizionia sediminis]|uniref:Arsenate reductase family protein n=1 Tax=Bizionia sediminis TaxID=1737064 RepID=A0ABW5KRT8_9FLAO
MKKVYYLKSCNTCTRILNDIKWPADVVFQDIKQEAITAAQLEAMRALSGSYQALFSKRAQLYKAMDLKNVQLEEADYKNYILEHYTFLSRPVVIYNNNIFIGSSKKNIENLKAALRE